MTGNEERKAANQDTSGVAPIESYTLDALAASVPSGTNLLVRGPPMSGKVALQRTLLTEGLNREQGVVFATVTKGGAAVLTDMQSRIPSNVARMGVIDCNAGQSSNGAPKQISQIASPADLTGIGIEVSRWFTRFEQDQATTGVRFSIDSLSSMLMYADLQRVFRFMHVLTNRIRQADGLGLFGFNPHSHDDKTVNTLTQLFDGQIVVHHDDDPSLVLRNR